MVGIASVYYKHNYGSILQAYATQEILDRYGISNETISINKISDNIKKKKIKYFIKASFTSLILKDKWQLIVVKLLKKNSFSKFGINSSIRDKRFDEFVSSRFRFSKNCSSIKELTEYVKANYSAVIVGSDQLWLPGNIAGDYYTLNFVPEEIKKISYATSFGQAFLPKDIQKKAQKFLSRIDYISVREQSGKELVYKLTKRNVDIVCDPVMLLTKEDWSKIVLKKLITSKKYILCYFLGNNPIQRQFCLNLKRKTGLKIVGLLHLDEYIKADERIVDEALYDVGPDDFVNLIRNAEYVCTDSFHASVFSIIHHKNFFTFRRYCNSTKQSTNSRIDTLFEQMHISRPILSGKEDVENIINYILDYNIIENCLNEYRDKSLHYLLSSLGEINTSDR